MSDDPIKDLGLFTPEEARRLVNRTRGKAFFVHYTFEARVEGKPDHYWPAHGTFNLPARTVMEFLRELQASSDRRERADPPREPLRVNIHASERCMFIR